MPRTISQKQNSVHKITEYTDEVPRIDKLIETQSRIEAVRAGERKEGRTIA